MNKNLTKKALLFSFLLVFSVIQLKASGEFSGDREAFLQEVESYLSTSASPQCAQLLKNLSTKIKGTVICDAGFNSIVEVCNAMIDQKMPTKTCFIPYLETICTWKDECKGSCMLEDWNTVYVNLIGSLPNRNFKPFQNFLAFSQTFFELKALKSSPSSVTWSIGEASECQIQWMEGQPVLVVGATTFQGKLKENAISIENTTGKYFPLTETWSGQGGAVRWTRIQPASKIYCELGAYELKTDKKEFSGEDAKLYYPELFGNQPIVGKFSDKLLAEAVGEKSTWPRFESTTTTHQVKNWVQGVTYTGGFGLEGLTIHGTGVGNQPAKLEIFANEAQPIAILASKKFTLNQMGNLVGQAVQASVYFGQSDSLYHPAINVKYEPGKKMVFYKGEKSLTKSPWYDSYHQVYLDAARIELDLVTGQFAINPKATGTAGTGERLYVDSKDFFDKNDYFRWQNVSTVHPVALMVKLVEEKGTTLNVSELAQRINPTFTPANIRSLLFDLEEKGYVNYDVDQETVLVHERAVRAVKSSQGKTDNDYFRFESTYHETNAIVDPVKKTITLEGVADFCLHPRPRVAVAPSHQRVVLKANRGLDFGGKIFAGLSVLEGHGFHFDYEKFQVQADTISTFDLYLPTGGSDKNGAPNAAAIGSRIENVSGLLLLNAPGNKSGRELLPTFPAFRATGHGYVYYDQRNLQGQVYSRDSFYFKLNPFIFNHLGNISPKDLQFEGSLVSAGIFPDFKEKLVLQADDKSLGFVTETPEKGFSTYSKGNYVGNLRLSNAGLTGKGQLAYGATKVNAVDFTFKPNQATCKAETFDLEEDLRKSVPKVHGEEVAINWLPKEDSMFITSTSKSFQLFNDGSHEIGGTLIYMPGSLKGRGIFKWGEGEMKSELFAFGSNSVKTEKTDLQIKAFDTQKLALETKNLRGKIDFKEQKGRFSANVQTEVTTLPFNNYITTLNEFEWDLGKKSLTFIAPKGQNGLFLSTDGGQDSLRYLGGSATYDFDNGQLDIGDVEFIESADAMIYPSEGKVKVLPGGALATLTHAKIVADSKKRYHQIVDATVTMKGRQRYEATGFYAYDLPGRSQLIELKQIIGKGKPGSDKATTEATTEIAEELGFYLDAKTRYLGKVSLNSSNPWLDFDGFAQLEMPALKASQWFEVKFKGDYKHLLIACNEPENREGTTLFSGLYADAENPKVYTLVNMPMTSKRSREFFSAKGTVRYDAATDAFVFGDSTKVNKPLEPGNLLYFHNKNAIVKAEGTFNLCEFAKEIGFKVAGVAQSGLSAEKLNEPQLANTDVVLDVVAGFNFNLPKTLMKIMLDDFESAKLEAEPVVYGNAIRYLPAIANWVEKGKKRTEVWSELTTKHALNLPDEAEWQSFVLGELSLVWDEALQSFSSKNNRTALVSMNGIGVHRYIEATVEFHNPTNKDDRIYLLLKSPSGHSYYFNYKKGIVHAYSDHLEFNETIARLKDKERMISVKNGTSYELQTTTPELVEAYRNRMND